MPRRAYSALLLIAIVTACSRDPGRDVRPMSRGAASTPAPTAILPLDQVAKSQAAIVGQRIANTEITITYSRPVARGRTLFGGIVPYNEAWDPGADQATAIALTRDVRLEGHALAAGKYSVWMIPRPDVWTVILSKAGDAYHTPYPGEAQDALRFDVKPQSAPHTETLTFDFPVVEGKDTQLQFRWGEVMIPLRVTVP